ncbi:AraC family transcriptional regulator [uncultured Shimia sp.]|uniref:AraC family transcriptional regulator n=1 Tax=uncultured Shimia sp. TaxID=573152 RepID=UPI002637C137|nr:AraC family transcriptional regulator [uncultured Shimia sp.]
MKQVRSVRFGYVSETLQRKLGVQVGERLLRKVGRYPGTKQLATVKQEAALIRAACLEMHEPTLAAQMGIGYRDAPTLSSYIAARSKTLRAAVENAAKFYSLADPTTRFELREIAEGEALEVVSLDAGLQANERFQEFLVIGMLARIQSITRQDTRPTRVVFKHAVLGDVRAYERIAGCPVQFGGGFNGLRFAQGVPDVPLGEHDPDLVGHLTRLAEAQLREVDVDDGRLWDRVERMLVQALPERFLTADEVAEQLGITRRTLTRRLGAEGGSYRDLCNGLRYRLAKAHLRDGRSVTETTFLLAYKDQASFSTAFKGWSGAAPSAFVAALDAS